MKPNTIRTAIRWISRISLIALAVMLLVTPALAQNGDTGDNPVLNLAEQVVVIAAMVSAVLQGLKKLFSNLQGAVAIVFAVLGSLAGAYGIAPADQVFSLTFLFQAVLTALGSLGVYGLVKLKTG